MLLLDTNVVSEMRRLIDPNLADWAHTLDPAEAYLSAITIQELEIGVQLKERRDKPHGLILRQWLEQQVYPTFEGRILPVDMAVARRSAAFHIPNPAPIRDSLIAATALEHRMILVTRNVSDFERTGVQILNPFEAA